MRRRRNHATKRQMKRPSWAAIFGVIHDDGVALYPTTLGRVQVHVVWRGCALPTRVDGGGQVGQHAAKVLSTAHVRSFATLVLPDDDHDDSTRRERSNTCKVKFIISSSPYRPRPRSTALDKGLDGRKQWHDAREPTKAKAAPEDNGRWGERHVHRIKTGKCHKKRSSGMIAMVCIEHKI